MASFKRELDLGQELPEEAAKEAVVREMRALGGGEPDRDEAAARAKVAEAARELRAVIEAKAPASVARCIHGVPVMAGRRGAASYGPCMLCARAEWYGREAETTEEVNRRKG